MLMSCLSGEGWELSASGDADLIIVNSCGFIESAKRESINTVLSFRALFPQKKIVLAGCLAARYAGELRESLPEADLICPSSDPREVAAFVCGKKDAGGKINDGARPLLSLPGSAYLKIAEGCNNACSFCAIPLIRGNLRSRTIPDIHEEFALLLRRGIKEVCLIAQDTAAYGAETEGKPRLAALLANLLESDGDFWIRLLYLHPDHFPEALLPLMQADARLLPYFDIPFQHASKKTLSSMGRLGDSDTYLQLIRTIRAALPNAVLRSTFLVGFPGETDADFEELLAFQQNAALDWAGVFSYSPEEGTPAFTLKNRPAKKVAAARKTRLEEAQLSLSEKKLERFISKTLDVLVEEKIEGEAGLYLGRSYGQAPEVDGAIVLETAPVAALAPGSFVRGEIFARAGLDLRLR
jgi:ribosomal protein S12 methylthiotransferase